MFKISLWSVCGIVKSVGGKSLEILGGHVGGGNSVGAIVGYWLVGVWEDYRRNISNSNTI